MLRTNYSELIPFRMLPRKIFKTICFRVCLLSWLSICIAGYAQAQEPEESVEQRVQQDQLTVSGKVTSAADGAPLTGVTIAVKGTATTTQTDTSGRYSMKKLT